MMKKFYQSCLTAFIFFPFILYSQTNEWSAQYVTTDDGVNGTGWQTSSVAVVGPDRFVALVTRSPENIADLFTIRENYLVGYWDADSVLGRTGFQEYQPSGQKEIWASGLDQVTFDGVWQIVGGKNNWIYVANNDDNHNILVFELTALGVVSTDYRMETGSENIFAIDVDTAGYVYVADYEGTAAKTNEVRVYAPIGAPGTTWGEVGGHNDAPVATIDLPPGRYQGITASGDGTRIFVSATSERRLLKFTGSPSAGYTLDPTYDLVLSPADTIGNGGFGTPSFLGLAYYDEVDLVFAVADSFIHIGTLGGYPYGRIYVISPEVAFIADTIDIAEWNFRNSGAYNSRPGGTAGTYGGYTSVCDVDVSDEPAIYTQSYYGWDVEKWIFDGDLGILVSVASRPETVPQTLALHQNYPNPFNPGTTIQFDLPRPGEVSLTIYNLLGKEIRTLLQGYRSEGAYRLTWDGKNNEGQSVGAGVYLYVVKSGDFVESRKMTLVK